MGVETPELFPEESADAWSIGALFRELARALSVAFPRGRGSWVKGEIKAISEHPRSGHCYMELVDPQEGLGGDAPVLSVNCWRTAWGPMKALLAEQGIELAPGMVVTLRGRVELYAPRSSVNFIASEIDVSALLGKLAARRAALLRALGHEGLLERNASLLVPQVPLRIGLVASPGTEGYNDFMSCLEESALAFEVLVSRAIVQGSKAPASICAALAALRDASCDVVAVVRGGGAKADLAAFDSEPVARAIATFPVPVWTGIGHTRDESVADIVANHACRTPTQCAQELVHLVGSWWGGVLARAQMIADGARRSLAGGEARTLAVRARLVRSSRNELVLRKRSVADRSSLVGKLAVRQARSAGTALSTRADRLGFRPVGALGREEERLVARRRLLDAYDLERQLRRGFTLTLDRSGRLVRSAVSLEAGARIRTRFADGVVGSVVEGGGADGHDG